MNSLTSVVFALFQSIPPEAGPNRCYRGAYAEVFENVLLQDCQSHSRLSHHHGRNGVLVRIEHRMMGRRTGNRDAPAGLSGEANPPDSRRRRNIVARRCLSRRGIGKAQTDHAIA